MKKYWSRGSASIEASLVFPIFIFAYLILLNLVLNIVTESITKKALYEVSFDLANIVEAVDRANYASEISVGDFDIGKYEEIIVDAVFNDLTNINKENLKKQILDQGKADIENLAKQTIFKSLTKDFLINKIKNISMVDLESMGIVGGLNGIDIDRLNILQEGNRLEVGLSYEFYLDRYGLLNLTNTIQQTVVLDTWTLLNEKKSEFESIWNQNNFDRGRYFANLLRSESDLPLKTGQVFDYIESSNTLVQVYSLNIFTPFYSNQDGGKYLVSDNFIKQLENYKNGMFNDFVESNRKFESQDGHDIEMKNANLKLVIILPEEAQEMTNLNAKLDQINQIANIEFKFIERAFNDSN